MYGLDVTLVLQVASVRELQGDIQYEVYEVNHAREARALVGLVANLRQALAMSGAAFSRGSASSRLLFREVERYYAATAADRTKNVSWKNAEIFLFKLRSAIWYLACLCPRDPAAFW